MFEDGLLGEGKAGERIADIIKSRLGL